MPVFFHSHIRAAQIKAAPLQRFVFGDNLKRIGSGGQAFEMRGHPNSIGVATKKAPTYNPEDFFTDDELHENIRIFHTDLAPAIDWLKQGGTVVIPSAGLGTGLSELPKRAPITNTYLNNLLFKVLPEMFPDPS